MYMQLGLADEGEADSCVWTTAPDAIVQVCQDHSELALTMARLVGGMRLDAPLESCPTVLHLVNCLLYWVAQRAGQPAWGALHSRRVTSRLLLGPHCVGTGVRVRAAVG
ncbi:MAG: hypothetical protein LBK95_10675 [Bifidobacteriaceae bacterium]|nr:hypothetical protein [Bifidobacteriaceae bacterium]